MAEIIGFGSHIIKYEKKYENKDINRNLKISFLFIKLYFTNKRIIYIFINNKDRYINKK